MPEPEIVNLEYSPVDTHVHLRFGQEHKEDYWSGTRAALRGGVTMVWDMPNNPTLVTSVDHLRQKREAAAGSVVCDIAFHLGTLGEASQDYMGAEPYVYAIKAYFEDSTNHYHIKDSEKRENVFRFWDSPKVVMLHAVGQSLREGLQHAKKYGRRVYVCHSVTEEDHDQIRRAKDERPGMVFAEITPHHLAFDSLRSSDPWMQMLPPLGEILDRASGWERLRDGTIDVVATDHAPHTVQEKLRGSCYGVTGLEMMLPFLLTAERNGWISMEKIKEVTHDNPLKIMGILAQPDTYTKVMRGKLWDFKEEEMETRVKHSPFRGWRFQDRVEEVVLRGKTVVRQGQVIATPGTGLVLPQGLV